MDNQTDPESGFRRRWRWLTTPPQVYVLYLVGLIVVWMVSFYAGTLNPRKTVTPIAPPVSAPVR
ncbi:hypothetical protein [Bradyrhizobium sp. ARR65]|uniref:hypothetical protein n=1 Tax=Bradyrhizobium sp. ARR65 TaxID=1040989 RepID=UPI000A038957|nr:hypothetical protein [Bradyrhizobium sp. ARR65]